MSGKWSSVLVSALLAVVLLAPAASAAETDSDQAASSSVVSDGRAVSECGPPPASGPFIDVSGTHQFCADIKWLADTGVTNGYDDGTFRPVAVITRQAMAAFLYRYSGSPAFSPPAVPSFSDVPGIHTFFAEIEWLASTDITDGYDDDTFRPTDAVSRQAMAAFMYRLADEPAFVPPMTPSFSDVGTTHLFATEIEWFADTGITTGYVDGTYRPTEPVTRQAYAAFQHRYHQLFGEFDNEISVQLHWQSEYRTAEEAFGGVDDYAAFHLPDDGAGVVTLKWDDDGDAVVAEGHALITSRIANSGFHLHAGAPDEEGPVVVALPQPTFVGDAEPAAADRGLYTYSLGGQVAADPSLLADLQSALASTTGPVDWYVNVHTVHNPAGEVRGQLGASLTGAALDAVVPVFKNFEFHELGEGTNTGEDQTSFNLWFDADIAFAGQTGQQRPQPADFLLTINGVEQEILRVRGDNPEWQPYPKQDIRVHLDTHEVVEAGDVVEITLLDSGAAKLVPVGRNSGAENLSESWRTRCTVVLSVPAMTSEPCGTPPLPGLSNFSATSIDSAPNQEQEFSVTVEGPGLPPRPAGHGDDFDGEPWELWVELEEVSFDGLVDYSGSTWTATIGGVEVGTVEFWEYEETERFQTNWVPFLVFTHDEDEPIAGELVLSGSGVDGSDAAVFGTDTTHDTYVVRFDTGRADYAEIGVIHVPQPTITLSPVDAVVLAEDGAQIELTATHTDAGDVPVDGAAIRFWAEQGERPHIVEVPLGSAVTSGGGLATVTYDYDNRDVAVGEPLTDTVRAELIADPFVDAVTTVSWATGVATNEGPGAAVGATYYDLNDAVTDADEGDTITALGEFASLYGLPRGDRVRVTKSDLTLQADETGASLLGAFDVRASGVVLDGFYIQHAGSMQYAVRVEGADITISNNLIEANGADGIRVRDPWGPVVGGGSAVISGNDVRGAAIAIDIDNYDQVTPLVTDLTIASNLFEDNGVGIHYNPAGGTSTITGNGFLAGDLGDVYVRDATEAEVLDLEGLVDEVVSGNSYDPDGEILGRSIVPIDPNHTPSMVRVVEHGTGQGNQYTVIEYTRGVACDGGAATGEQFTLDRGTENTPNRTGATVDCDYGRNQILVTWDGNPSFPNEIFYNQHPLPQYRIHNEYFVEAHAVSPDSVGPPFLKPDDDAAVSGAVHMTTSGFTIDGLPFEQGAEVPDVDLSVRISDRSEPANLSLWFDGARPGEGFIAGETICSELLTAQSCTTITDALVANDGFAGDTTFLDGVVLEVNGTAPVGTWQLRWWVVDSTTTEPYFSDTFQITITTTP